MTVPTDEGEVEAQPPAPIFTIRLLHPDGQAAEFPFDCRVEVDAGWKRTLKTAGLDAALAERVVYWADHNGWATTSPVLTWEDVEGVHCRTATFTVTGYREDPSP